MMESLVSVVITSYKRVESTVRAVKSVLVQDYDNIEVIVVDDNGLSTREQRATERSVCEVNDRRVRYIAHDSNRGGNAARNTGVRNSKGEFIAFLDNDDVYCKSKIRLQVQFLDKNALYSAVSCGRVYLNDHNIRCSSYSGDVNSQGLFLLGWQDSGGTSSLCFRKDKLTETGLFDESLKRQQEVELLFRFLANHRLFVLHQHLVEVDTSDRSNIPSTKRYIENKKHFLKLCRNHFISHNIVLWIAIKGFHSYDVCKVAFRNRDFIDFFKQGFFAALCIPSWPFIFNDLRKRLTKR